MRRRWKNAKRKAKGDGGCKKNWRWKRNPSKKEKRKRKTAHKAISFWVWSFFPRTPFRPFPSFHNSAPSFSVFGSFSTWERTKCVKKRAEGGKFLEILEKARVSLANFAHTTWIFFSLNLSYSLMPFFDWLLLLLSFSICLCLSLSLSLFVTAAHDHFQITRAAGNEFRGIFGVWNTESERHDEKERKISRKAASEGEKRGKSEKRGCLYSR